MKKGFRLRFTAVLLTVALLFTSNYMLLNVFADTPTPGIGIYNHVMTDDSESETKYLLKFYRTVVTVNEDETTVTKTPVSLPNEMEVDAARHLYLTPEGDNASIILGKDDEIVLSGSDRFKSFLKQFKIDTIKISYQTGMLNQKETSLLYSDQVKTYSFVNEDGTPKTIGTDPVTEEPIPLVDYDADNPFEHINECLTVEQFDSTKMTTIDVQQNWRDRGTGRPEMNEVTFDLKKDGEEYLAYNGGTYVQSADHYQFADVGTAPQHNAYLELEQTTSNTYLYHYTVPEYNPNGSKIVYTSVQHFPEPGEGDTNYKHEDQPNKNNYLAIGLTDFTFKMNYADKYDPLARPDITAQYLDDHFKFMRMGKNGATDEQITLDPNDFKVVHNGDGTYSVTIKNLEDIAEDGTANEYYLALNDPSNPRMTINPAAPKAAQSDYYAVRSENDGIHASVTDKTFNNGTLDLLLSGTTNFNAHVQWDDIEVTAARKADKTAARLNLWRFVGDEDDESAIVDNKVVLEGTDETISYTDLPKYDITGDIYTYYVHEEVTVEKGGVVQPYQITYKDASDQVNPKDRLENGGTVVNKLSDTVVYSVSADWVAAARQGGTASVTYQLQRRLKTAEGTEQWVPVGDDKIIQFDELHMSRGGTEDCKFPKVDIYNEHGQLYEYRVIQTSVTRTDVMKENDPPVSKTDDTDITDLGQHSIEANDSYFVVLTNPEGTTDFHFHYQIQGNTKVDIEKKWLDQNRQQINIPANSTEYSATFDVQNFNQKNLQYRNYFIKSEYPEGYFDAYTGSDGYFTDKDEQGHPLTDGSGKEIVRFKQQTLQGATWSIDDIPVPRFDSDGREIVYRAVEVPGQKHYPTTMMIDGKEEEVSFYSTYQWYVTNEEDNAHTTNYEYKVTNVLSIEGGDHAEIAVNKEWVDDGELEFRRPVQINASGRIYQQENEYGEWTDIDPNGSSRLLKNENVWESRFPITIKYRRDEDGKRVKDENGKYIIDHIYHYDPDDFTETPEDVSNPKGYYWTMDDIERAKADAGGHLPDEDLDWIYELLTSKHWHGDDMSDDLNDGNSHNLMESNRIGFEDIVGIYKSKPIDTDQRHCHYYAVRQIWEEGGVNGAYATLRFINTRIGIVNYEIRLDWKVGDALTRQDGKINQITIKIEGKGLPNGSIEQVIDPSHLVRLNNGDYAYYLLNLPKYDEEGKLIEYKITEIAINDESVNDDNVVMVGNDRCTVSVSDEGIIEGDAARSDDLHTIRITNTFKDDVDFKVHKQWIDNQNAENTRSDLYIKLFRISHNPNATAEDGTVDSPKRIGTEYKWEQQEHDELNNWTYHFEELPKYDAQGYPYTYYVKEQDHLQFYKQEYARNDMISPTEKNPLVFLTDEQLGLQSMQNVAFDDGTITNRLYDELVINGEKLWKNISGLLEKADYPIAYVTLYRDLSNLTAEEKAELNLTEEERASNEIRISTVTAVRNGDISFKFTDAVPSGKQYGVALDDNGNVRTENGNIILLKYNEFGKRIHYKMKEESLNGYISKIEDSKLINEYNGGRKLNFKVTKHWEGMEDQHNFPTIKFVLHQVFAVPDGNDGTKYYEMNHFEREYRANDKINYTVTFGDKPMEEEALRYYSPVGEPYTYFITETISNYDGDQALFIEPEHEALIPKYLQQFRTNPKAQVVYIDSTSDNKGLALGFSAQRTDYLGDARDNIRRVLFPTNGDVLPIPDDIIVPLPDTPEYHITTPTELEMRQAFDMLTEKQKLQLHTFDELTLEQQAEAFNLLTNLQKYNIYGDVNVQYSDLTPEQKQAAFDALTDDQLEILFITSDVMTFDSLTDEMKQAAFDALTPAQQHQLFEQHNDAVFNALTPEQQQLVYDQLNARDATPVKLDEEVQNTYQPDENNFQGKLDVSKQWEYPVNVNERNRDYDSVRAYNFTVSRKTKLSNEETLFKVKTSDEHTTNPPSPTFSYLADGISMNSYDLYGTIRPHDFEPSMTASREIVPPEQGQTPKYYVGVLLKDNKAVTVVIEVADQSGELDYHNDVHIDGLAIYGHDALLYTYTITEEVKPGYTAVVKSGSAKLAQENSQTTTTPKINLKNKLEVFDLTINKSFGREYTDENNQPVIDPIPKDDFPQFFNDEYFGQLTFQLFRSSASEQANAYKTITGSQILALAGLGSDTSQATDETKQYNGLKETDEKDNAYYFHVFRDLPLTDTNGNYYTYWLKEIDGAQSGGSEKVFTLYSPELRTKETTDQISNAADVNIPLSASDNNSHKELYTQNVFKSKRITINKFWLDNNNEDGNRPEQLTVTVSEKVPNGNGDNQDRIYNFDRILQKEDSTGEVGWTLEAALARYYFNGVVALDNLEYKISEEVLQDYQVVVDRTEGDITGDRYVVPRAEDHRVPPVDNGDPNAYTVPGTVSGTSVPVSDVYYQPIGNLNDDTGRMTSLNITNYKKPQKGELTLEKKFDPLDENFKNDTRPASLHFMLTDQLGNALIQQRYTDLKITVTVGGVEVTPAENGVITINRNADCSYPAIVVTGLPIGSSTGGAVQQNGTFVANQYKFVECDSTGTVLTGNESFPYNWNGKELGSQSATVKIDSSKNYQNTFEITNTLKTEDHTVTKRWQDDANNGHANYYHTRPKYFHTKLQRRIEADGDNWTTVVADIELQTLLDSLNADNYTENSENPNITQSAFRNLPEYDSNGNKYYYRVVETYIGPREDKYAVNNTYHDLITNHDYPAAKVYYVVYDDQLFDKSTSIENHLIRKTKYQNFQVKKTWNDNLNQDAKRDAIQVRLVQTANNVITNVSYEWLKESNNWFYEWRNYPNNDENGTPYEYFVFEDTDIDGYSTNNNHVLVYNPAHEGEYDENSYEGTEFTNSYNPVYKNLYVNKKWLGDEQSKQVRPTGLTFELYCKYTAYKYAATDGSDVSTDELKAAAKDAGKLTFAVDPEKSYEGPVYGATQLLQAMYEDYKRSAGVNAQSREDYIDSLTPEYFVQTLTPADRMDDAQWNNQITFTHLPVYINTCATDRWLGQNYAVEYYVKEREPALESGKTNPYIYGVNGYNGTELTGEGNSQITTLIDNNTPANKTVTASNKLKKRNITVQKIWNDNGYGESLHYDIDFTLKCTNASVASQYAYEQAKTLQIADNPRTVTFTDLPIYDQDGTMLNYEVTEKVSDTQSTYVQYGYEQSLPVPTTESESGVLIGYTITNTLPVVKFKATKYWNDNFNQDGMRPGQLDLTLQRTAEGTTDTVTTLSDTSQAHRQTSDTLWQVDFGIHPKYNINNVEYVYSVTEEANGTGTLAQRGYQRYVTPSALAADVPKSDYVITDNAEARSEGALTTATGDETDRTFWFKNKYTPKDDNLKIKKSWVDTAGGIDFSSWTRPQEVTVTLHYQYGSTAVTNLATAPADDHVKKLFPSEYAFTRQVKAGESWENVFDDLPLYVNPTGTATFNGQEYQITYSVTEEPLNGYTTAYSASVKPNGTDSVDELTVTNTLKTKTVKVKKEWDDRSYSGDQNDHYDVHLTLANTNSGVRYTANNMIPKTDEAVTGTVDFIVPEYIANGDAATFTVTEDAVDQKYRYQTTYSSNHDFNAATIADNSVITVSNRLPLTEITFQKNWEDSNNIYQLRPDSIRIQLSRRPVTNNGVAWESADDGWQNCGEKVTVTGSSWAHTFDKLPKFDAHNIEYEYKIVEDKVNAYDTAYQTDSGYQDNPVVRPDNNDQTADSTLSFAVKNTLITQPITLVKVWNDNDYPDDLRYPVTFTIAKPSGAAFSFTDVPVTLSNASTPGTKDGHVTWSETQTVPVYDKSGNPIQYTVTEENSHHYGYHQKGGTDVTQNGVYTGNGQYYGNFYDTYTITNELPLTEVTAQKQWAGDLELYPNASAMVKVNLTRKSGNQSDNTFNLEQQIAYSNGMNDSVTFGKLLVKDYNNNDYTYTITEQTVRGYSTAYSNQNILSTAANHTAIVTNTPLKGSADFVKYDFTDWTKHGSDSRFHLKTLSDAQFELYREREGMADQKFWFTHQSDVYTIVPQGTAGATDKLISGADGKIAITNLEPNKYYLKETTAPTGYQLNNTRFAFEVSVNDSNQIVVTYTRSETPAANALTDLSQITSTTAPASANGIPNEENLSRLTLQKVDKDQPDLKLPYASYYLLRLYDFEYKQSGAQGANADAYLANALNTLTADYSDASALWTYWERVGNPTYTTDQNGSIDVEGHMFGTYVFYEVKNPVGFERDFTHNATTAAVASNPNVIGPVYFEPNTAQHEQVVYHLTHEDPRKKAEIKILKTDENGNPLNNAVFKLYKDGAPDTVLATVTTGYDGLNPTAIVLDTTQYEWGQKFYFIEETAPTGYAPHNEGEEKNKIEFSLTHDVADETLHVVRANDVRLKGSVVLTKTSSAATTTTKAGSPLANAVFKLYTKSGTQPLHLYTHSTAPNKYRVRYDTDLEEEITSFGYTHSSNVTTMTTDSDGKLTVEGIEWGDFYLKEVTAPTGYKLPTGDDAKVSFSVGRNNAALQQQLEMKNDPQTAQLNIIKHIDRKNVAAWGEPVFIFKVHQTAYYDYNNGNYVAIEEAKQPTLTKTISPRTADTNGFKDETGWFDLEPGSYTVTEVRVARYKAATNSVTTDRSDPTGKVTIMSNTPYQATFDLAPDGKAEVRYDNRLANYEKLNHADEKHNVFNGYKALHVSDKDGLQLDQQGEVTINKSDLLPKLIKSDGSTTAITDYAALTITSSESEITVTDNGNTITVSGRAEDVVSSVYKLNAAYAGLTTDFELRFSANPLFNKTEKTVIFRNDDQNRSYYADGEQHNAIYSLIFIIDSNSGTPVVKKIMHNGVSTGNTTTESFPTLNMESMFNTLTFDKWCYAYKDGGNDYTGDVDSNGLMVAIKSAPDDAVITVTALLKNKS